MASPTSKPPSKPVQALIPLEALQSDSGIQWKHGIRSTAMQLYTVGRLTLRCPYRSWLADVLLCFLIIGREETSVKVFFY